MSDILNKNTWTTKHMLTAIIITGSIVFSGSMIWSRFLYGETTLKNLKTNTELRMKNIEARIEYVNTRIDTKHKSQQEDFEEKILVIKEDNLNQWGAINGKKDK